MLASASPRRREILQQLALQFRVIESGADEGEAGTTPPEAYARTTAERKAMDARDE